MAEAGAGDLRDRINAGKRIEPQPSGSGTGKQKSPAKKSKTIQRKREPSSSSSSSTSSSSSDSSSERARRRRHKRPERKRSESRGGRPARRSRSGLFRLVRSPSRELYREDEKVQRIKQLVNSQQEFILELLTEHKAEVENKLQTKQRRFQSKQLEKQFEVNSGFKELVEKAQSKLKLREYKLVEQLLEKLYVDIDQHEQDLLIADALPFGWLAVAKIRGTAELPKNIRKRLEQVDRELSAQKNRNGGARKKYGGVPGASAEPVIRRADKRSTPEEALFQAGKQLRAGTCSHCKKELHYYKECPLFWAKVQESRIAKAKEESGAN
jgi:hypothetical protein